MYPHTGTQLVYLDDKHIGLEIRERKYKENERENNAHWLLRLSVSSIRSGNYTGIGRRIREMQYSRETHNTGEPGDRLKKQSSHRVMMSHCLSQGSR